jgi:site-specific DNA-methyltransferase (adenine-specific)
MTLASYYADDTITLYHGDCREITEWLKADVLITDPPYGIPNGRLSKHEGRVVPVHADAIWDELLIRDEALELWGNRPRAVFGSPKMSHISHRGVPVIWDKGDDPGMGDYTWPFGVNYELIWIHGDGWKGQRRGSIIRAPRLTSDARDIGHPTPKPLPLMDLLVNYAPRGVIADPFAGSGSTLISAARMGRRAVGVEAVERYCEIAARRLSQGVLDFGEVS